MKRAWIILAVIATSAVVLVIMFSRDREPRYQGRALSAWIDDAISADNEPKWQSASNAIYEIGTNALPTFLKWAFAKDSKRKAAVIDWLDAHPSLHFYIREDWEWQMMARDGFDLLGDKVESAWPIFVQYTHGDDSTRRNMALMWLVDTSHTDAIAFTHPTNPFLVPVALRLFKDSDKDVERRAALILIDDYPKEAEAAGVFKVFPKPGTPIN